MYLDKYFNKLKSSTLKNDEYNSLKSQCIRLVKKACNRYHLNDLSYNSAVKLDIIDDIYINSLMKALRYHDNEKGSFSTYFFYKACSAARVEAGKLKRRSIIHNTCSFDESLIV
jgi:hypothetical protein